MGYYKDFNRKIKIVEENCRTILTRKILREINFSYESDFFVISALENKDGISFDKHNMYNSQEIDIQGNAEIRTPDTCARIYIPRGVLEEISFNKDTDVFAAYTNGEDKITYRKIKLNRVRNDSKVYGGKFSGK